MKAAAAKKQRVGPWTVASISITVLGSILEGLPPPTSRERASRLSSDRYLGLHSAGAAVLLLRRLLSLRALIVHAATNTATENVRLPPPVNLRGIPGQQQQLLLQKGGGLAADCCQGCNSVV